MTFTECQKEKEDEKMYEIGIAEEIAKLSEAGAKFLEMCEEEVLKCMRSESKTSEESLQKEFLFELMDHVYGIRHITEYMNKQIIKEGILDRNEAGEIVMDGEVLPLMAEIEVLVYDEDAGMEVWTRVFVGGSGRRYLVGVNKDREIRGIHARIRA